MVNCLYPKYEESRFTGSEAVYSTPEGSDIHNGGHRNIKFYTAQRSLQNGTESEKNNQFVARYVAWNITFIELEHIKTKARKIKCRERYLNLR
jgi:hypothetical protein